MTVLTLTGKAIDWSAKTLDPRMLVQWQPDFGSIPKQYKGSLRTCAHQDWMDRRAHALFGQGIHIIQTPYNTDVPASAGTHDYDVMRDWWIPGLGWWDTQRFGRAHGEFCWYRHPPLFGNHIHGGTLPVPEGSVRFDDFTTKVGVFVPGQLVDYYNHAFGLANAHTPGSDRSWFPKNIDATVFNLNAYIAVQRENEMEYKDWSQKSKDMLADDIADRLFRKEKVNVVTDKGRQEVNVKNAITRAGSTPTVVRNNTDEILEAIDAAAEGNGGGSGGA